MIRSNMIWSTKKRIISVMTLSLKLTKMGYMRIKRPKTSNSFKRKKGKIFVSSEL